jgi:hypothetical protein
METSETITLDARAQQRLAVLTHLLTGGRTLEEAANGPARAGPPAPGRSPRDPPDMTVGHGIHR